MTDFAQVWHFTRFRLNEAIHDLSDAQLCWRLRENSHTIGEIVYHIAGAEHYWGTRLSSKSPDANEYDARLDSAVHDGFLREGGSPFAESEMTAAGIQKALSQSFEELKPVIESPTKAQLAMELTSPVGDEVTGRTGLARVAQHAGYHTGQIWMIRMDPRFPKS